MENLFNIGLRMLPSIPIAISAPAGTLVNTFFACSRFWIMLYGMILIIHDIFFTIFPTTLLVISALTLVLHYTRISPPPQQFLDAVFGYNPSITYPIFGSSSSSAAKSFMTDLAANIIGIASIPLQTAVNSLNLAGRPNLETTLNSFNLDPRITRIATQLLLGDRVAHNTNVDSDNSHHRIMATTFGTPSVSASASGFDLTRGLLNPTNSPTVPIIAHRGAGYDAPENSLAAFVRCKERGCTFVHFDLKLARDFVPLCFHDDDLYRITGIAKKFHDFSSNEIRMIDISLKHQHGQNFRGARIPTFDEAVETLIRLNLKFFINVLDTNQHIVDIVCGTYKKYQAMYAMAVVSSFHFKVIHDIRRKDDKIIGCVQFPYNDRVDFLDSRTRSFFLMNFFHQWWEIFHDWITEHFLWWFLGLSAVILEKNDVSKKQVAEWGKRGVRVFVSSVNHPMEKLYLNQVMSVAYITDTLEGDVVVNPAFTPQQLSKHEENPQFKGQVKAMQSIPPSRHPSDVSVDNTLKTTFTKEGRAEENAGRNVKIKKVCVHFHFINFRRGMTVTEQSFNLGHRTLRCHFSIRKFAERYKLGEPWAGNFFQTEWDEYVNVVRAKLGLPKL